MLVTYIHYKFNKYSLSECRPLLLDAGKRRQDEESINVTLCLFFFLPLTRTILLRHLLVLRCSILYTVPQIFCFFNIHLYIIMTFNSIVPAPPCHLPTFWSHNKNSLFANATQWDPRWCSPSYHISTDFSNSLFLASSRR